MSFRRMILGSAAALVAVSGAQAADLPMAEPVDYVRICDFDGWGAGIQIPGTETCLKISGYVRTQIDYVEPANRSDDAIQFYSKGYLKFDAINDTEYGVLRSVIDFGGTGGSELKLGKAYLQFNGFTMGYAGSFFDYTTGAGFYDGPASDATSKLFAYTYAGGNGFSATLSLEDNEARRGDKIIVLERNGAALAGIEVDANFTVGGVTVATIYGGKAMPDIVANARISQGWGTIQLSGAVHQLRSAIADVTISGVNHKLDTTYGYAAGLGTTFNIMSGTSLSLQGQYTVGATSYAGFGDSDVTLDYDVVAKTLDLKRNKAWSALAALTHAWSSTVSQDFHVGYGSFDAPTALHDKTQLRLGTRVNYTGISGLYVGAGVGWTRTDYSSASGKADADTFNARLRVQRNF
ncbi:MAG: porin [Cohaesibacteraceae bacterium]|nr:porin [Cohaesibacteraceae bacterium]